MQPLLNIAISAARQAGDIISRHVEQLEHMKITAKGKDDFFCEIDVKAEQAIIHAIHKAYPDHGIIAEESGVQHEDAECVWIIDPLDGEGFVFLEPLCNSFNLFFIQAKVDSQSFEMFPF